MVCSEDTPSTEALLMHSRTSLLVVFAPLLVSCWLRGGQDYDLSRVTPVPPNEQIPLVDFFRPNVFESPSLNRSGTHIARLRREASPGATRPVPLLRRARMPVRRARAREL